jgi:hypothetical protein
VERHDAVNRLVELYKPILEALKELQEKNANTETSAKAHQLASSMEQGQFLTSLFVAKELFGLTLPLCKVLQAVDCDLALAYNHVETVVQTVVGLPEDVDSSFDSLYPKIEDFARDLKIELTFSRVGHRRNDLYDIGSPKEAHRTSIYIPFMEYFMSELKEIFTVHCIFLTTLSGFIPAN